VGIAGGGAALGRGFGGREPSDGVIGGRDEQRRCGAWFVGVERWSVGGGALGGSVGAEGGGGTGRRGMGIGSGWVSVWEGGEEFLWF